MVEQMKIIIISALVIDLCEVRWVEDGVGIARNGELEVGRGMWVMRRRGMVIVIDIINFIIISISIIVIIVRNTSVSVID